MKKLFLILLFLLISSPVMAKTITVQAMEDFTTENPPKTMNVRVMEEIALDREVTLYADYILNGEVFDVTDPKRLKRNAKFSFLPLSYTDLNGQITEIKGYYPAKYTTKANKKEIAKSAALTVGNHFVKGLSVGYKAIEGAVKNEKDNRFKSGANAVYESTPFSYVEKGGQIVILKDQYFYLNFKVQKEEDLPNYEYTELEN